MYIYVYMYICIYVYMYICIYVYIYILLVINFFKLGGSSRSRFSFFKRALLVKSLVELDRLPSLLWPEPM